jgi:hypothetical protein
MTDKIKNPEQSGMMNITSRMIIGPDRISYQTAQRICVLNITRTVIQLRRGTQSVSQKTHIIFALSLKLKKQVNFGK